MTSGIGRPYEGQIGSALQRAEYEKQYLQPDSVVHQTPPPPHMPVSSNLEDEIAAVSSVLDIMESMIERLDSQLATVSRQAAAQVSPASRISDHSSAMENLPPALEHIRLLRYQAGRLTTYLGDISSRLAL